MSTTISSFLDDIDQSIEDNTLPDLPGAVPSAPPQPNGQPTPESTNDPFSTMRASLITYLSSLHIVTNVMQSIALGHPEYSDRIDAIMIPLVNGIDATVDRTAEMHMFLTEFAQSMGGDPPPDEPQPPNQAWADLFGHNL